MYTIGDFVFILSLEINRIARSKGQIGKEEKIVDRRQKSVSNYITNASRMSFLWLSVIYLKYR